jgi:hypothetical protein
MPKLELITQKQLCELGLTKYQARRLTIGIQLVQKIQRANAYNVQEVIVAINEYIQNKRIQAATRINLEKVKGILFPTLGNLIPGAFGEENSSDLGQLAQKLLATTLEVNHKLAKLERRSLEIKGRYD